ncbi:MAG: hypothetical protein Q8M18_07655 [Bradyrhizobium sp.]|nr:hypothetical protein [Bradyrhizobium sp.]
MASDPTAKTRVRIAFLLLFIVFAAGAWFVSDLSKWQDGSADREGRTALQGITSPAQIDAALAQHPQSRFLRLTAMATRSANETSAAAERLSGEVEPPAISKFGNLGAASRAELEALRRDLKTAEANATTFLPRYIALLKTERDSVEKFARSLPAGNETTNRFLDHIDKRHAEFTALMTRLLSARSELYRAYGDYVAFLVAESGGYKVVDGQFLFALQRTVDRYNVVARAMTAATQRVVELQEERKNWLQSQQQRWLQFVGGE